MLSNETNMVAKIFGVVTVVFVVSVSLFSDDVSAFRYFKNAINDGSVRRADVSIINFDAEMYRKTVNLFSDLIVTDENLKPLPFVVEKQSQMLLVSHPEECPSQMLSVSTDRLTFELENHKRIYATEIRLLPASGTYGKIVDVLCSNDRINWNVIRKGAIIFGIESLNIKQAAISFATNNSRYFKIEIHTPEFGHICPAEVMFADKSLSVSMFHQGKIKVDELKLYHNITLSRPMDTYTTQIEMNAISHRVTGNDCETVFSSMNQPLLGFMINFPEDNYSRTISIFGSNDEKNWILLNDGTYINLTLPDYQDQRNFFTIPESRYQYYLFRYNSVDSGREMDMTVKAYSAVYHIVMPGDLPPRIKVFYGGKVPPVKFVVPSLRSKDSSVIEYRLSPQCFNSDYGVDSHLSPLKISFMFVIILIAIILALIMRKLVRSYTRFRDGPL